MNTLSPVFATGKTIDGVRFRQHPSNAAVGFRTEKQNHIFILKILVVLVTLLFFATLSPISGVKGDNFNTENILQIINQDRANQGLLPLRINVDLANAAKAKAGHMIEHNYFSHTSPGGLKPWDFIRHEKIRYAFAGENLARGYTSIYELQEDFLKSPAHRENLFSPLFSEIGIAILSGKIDGEDAIITVQMFATPVDQFALNN